jgi:hypothetical protein
MRFPIPRAALALVACSSLSAEDDVPFPLGALGGKALQTEGSSLLRITEVTAGGPAATAGLQVGDFLHAVNGEKLPPTGSRYDDGWRGAVAELGYAIERAESVDGALALDVLRPGTGNLRLGATLPATSAWRPSYPVGDPRAASYFDKVCADIHERTTASSTGNFGANTGWHGIILLAHPQWNSSSGATPYRNSIDKLRDRCVNHLAGRVLEPVESGQPGYVDPGLENWDITASAMFLGEYRRKTGDTGVDAAVQRTAEMLANRIQHYANVDSGGTSQTKLGLMGHGGVVGDYPHVGLSGLNIINAHTMVAMGILKGAGADFNAASGSSGLTIDQKFLMNWAWLKSCMNTSGGNDDGNVGYGWKQGGYDSSGRTAGAAAGYEIYRAAGGTAATADDLDKLARMKAYSVRMWQRQQHAHAYTAGGVGFTQMLMPFLDDRGQRHFMENSRFLFTMSRGHDGSILYFPGRANSGGDSDGGYLGTANVKYYLGGLAHAVTSGNLPSFPAPSAARAFVRMNSPRNDWPQLAARRVKVTGLSHALDLDVTDHQGTPLASGYSAAWSQVSGAAVSFTSPGAADTGVNFPAAGNYRLRMTATVGSHVATEDYDFEVATTAPPAPVAPALVGHPVSRVAAPGGNAVFKVALTGDGPFLYEWRLDGVAYWGASTTADLALTNVSAGMAGSYQCTIYHPAGTLVSNSATLTVAATPTLASGGLRREVWNGISGGNVADLTARSNYPRLPDVTRTVTSAETPENSGDNYGERLSGWLLPPTTGQYRFYIASDDSSELWLSTTDSPANRVRIAFKSGYTGFRQYSAGGQSALITLSAGQRYHIEILHKEAGGGDHLSVAWQTPGGNAPANGSAPIPGQFFESIADVADPEFAGLQAWWKMDEGGGTVAADSMAGGADGTLAAPVWTSGRLSGGLAFDGNDRITCGNSASLGGSTPFTVAAWVKVNAGANSEAVIIQQRAANGFNGQYQLKVLSSGRLGFYVYGNSAEQFNFAGTTPVNDGQWHHVAAGRDDLGNATIYLDGVPDGSVSGTTVRSLSASIDVGIGCDIRDSVRYFRGVIDDVRVYNRYLGASEVTAVAGLVNRPPVFAADPVVKAGATQGAAYAGSLAGDASDPDAGDTLVFSKVSGPSWLAVAPDGTLSGTPGNAQVGPNSFVVRVTDADGLFDEATLQIAVANLNDAPVFTVDPISGPAATQGLAYGGSIAGTAGDIDAGDSLTYSKSSGPAWLAVAANGSLSGTPGNSDVGPNSLTVRVTDAGGLYDEATLLVTVANVNDAPSFTGDPITGPAATEDLAYSGGLGGRAGDIDEGDVLVFSKTDGPAWLTVAPDGTLGGIPSNSDVGANGFTVRVTDLAGLFDEALLTVLVANVNDAPVFTVDPVLRAAGREEVAYSAASLAGAAVDADAGDAIVYSKAGGPAWLTVAADGSLGGSPPTGSAGLNLFTVRATDLAGAFDEAALAIEVEGSTLPLPWEATTLGSGNLAGSATFSDGAYTVAGSGVLTGRNDSFGFAWQTLSGDGEIIARIEALDDTGASSRVGVMIRDTLASNSRHVFMGLSGDGDYRWVRRTGFNGNTSTSKSGSGAVPDTWVRLLRAGNTITAFKSSNGSSWTQVGSLSAAFPATCYVGLAVASGSQSTLNTSRFSQVAVTP